MLTNTHHSQGRNSHRSSYAGQGGPPDPDPRSNVPNPPDPTVNSDHPVSAQGETSESEDDINDGWISVNARRRKRNKMKSKKRKEKQQGKTWSQALNPNSNRSESEGNMLNEGNRPAHKNKESHYITNKTQKNIPENYESDIVDDYVEGESDAMMEAVDSEDKDLQEDIEFFIDEGTKGMNLRAFRDKAYHQRNQFEELLESSPEAFLVALLSEISSNPLTHCIDMVNDFKMSRLVMKRLFLDELNSRLPEARETLKLTRDEWEAAEIIKENIRAHPINQQDEQALYLRDRAEDEANSKYEVYDQSVVYNVALKIMQNIRIAQGKTYFTSVNVGEISDILRILGVDTHWSLTTAEVKRKIDEILIHQQIYSDEEPDQFFSFLKSNKSDGRLLYTAITYLPMEEDPQEYYKAYFLNPLDRIIKFMARPLGNNSGKIEAHVLIELGLDQIPPRKKTVGKMRQLLQQSYLTKNFEAVRLAKMKKDLEDYVMGNSMVDHPDRKRYKEAKEYKVKQYEHKMKQRDNVMSELENTPDHTPYTDRYDMTSRVLFNMQYCHLCNTTSHSYRNCAQRGCNICLHRGHVARRCRYKCECKKGRPHSIESCQSAYAMQKTQENRLRPLEVVRSENKAFTENFFAEVAAQEQEKATLDNEYEQAPQPEESNTTPQDPQMRVQPISTNPAATGQAYPTTEVLSSMAPNKNTPQQKEGAGLNPQSQVFSATPMSSLGVTDLTLVKQTWIPQEEGDMADSMGDTDEDDPQIRDYTMSEQRKDDNMMDERGNTSKDTDTSQREGQSGPPGSSY